MFKLKLLYTWRDLKEKENMHLLSPTILTRELIRALAYEKYSGRPAIVGDQISHYCEELELRTSELKLSLDDYSRIKISPIVKEFCQQFPRKDLFVADHLDIPPGGIAGGVESLDGISIRWLRYGEMLRWDFRIFQ